MNWVFMSVRVPVRTSIIRREQSRTQLQKPSGMPNSGNSGNSGNFDVLSESLWILDHSSF